MRPKPGRARETSGEGRAQGRGRRRPNQARRRGRAGGTRPPTAAGQGGGRAASPGPAERSRQAPSALVQRQNPGQRLLRATLVPSELRRSSETWDHVSGASSLKLPASRAGPDPVVSRCWRLLPCEVSWAFAAGHGAQSWKGYHQVWNVAPVLAKPGGLKGGQPRPWPGGVGLPRLLRHTGWRRGLLVPGAAGPTPRAAFLQWGTSWPLPRHLTVGSRPLGLGGMNRTQGGLHLPGEGSLLAAPPPSAISLKAPPAQGRGFPLVGPWGAGLGSLLEAAAAAAGTQGRFLRGGVLSQVMPPPSRTRVEKSPRGTRLA